MVFPGLGTWSTEKCVLTWSRQNPSAPVVTYQRLELGRLNTGEPCDEAQFGMLSTTLRRPEGITVELTEDLSPAGRYWLGLRAWRP